MFLLRLYDFFIHEKDGLHTEEAYAVCSQNKLLLMARMQEQIEDLQKNRTFYTRETKDLTYNGSLHIYAECDGEEYVIGIIEPIEVI